MTQLSFPSLAMLALVSGAAGALWGKRLCSRYRDGEPETLLRKARFIYVVVFFPLITIAANYMVAVRPSIQWHLPAWLQNGYQNIAWGISIGAMAVVFGFCSAIYLVRNHRHKWPITLISIIGLGGILFFCWTRSGVARPFLAVTPVTKDGVILQSSSSTCVPAACANVLTVLGIHATERDLARAFGTTAEGTLPGQAILGLQQLGVRTTKRTVRDHDLQTIKPPAILFVLLDTHAVAFIGMTNGLAEIWDPGSGRKLMKAESIRTIWQGHALECSRD